MLTNLRDVFISQSRSTNKYHSAC